MDNNNEHTLFPNSSAYEGEWVGEAHLAIENSDIHPFLIFAEIMQRPLDDFEYGSHFSLSDKLGNRDVAQPFIMPEPAALLSICLYLGVHPADIIPRDIEAPMPRSIVQLCRDMVGDDRFSESDREAAFELMEFEQRAIDSFRAKNGELWDYLAAHEFVVDDGYQEIPEIKFKSNSLQVMFADLVDEGINFEAVFPIVPDATILRTARNWDIRSKDEFAEQKVRPTYNDRKRKMKVLESIGGSIYGRDNVWQSYEATKEVLKDKEEIVVEDERAKAWVHACRDFYLADQAYEKAKAGFDETVAYIQKTYAQGRFDRATFDSALSFYENEVIMNSTGPVSPNLDHVLEA